MQTERISYKGWTDCWHLENAGIEVIVLADVGPRIIHLSLSGHENEFYEVAEDAGKSGGEAFRMYGGHRLWMAPEGASTAYPDNAPVSKQVHDDAATFIAEIETTGVQKQIEVEVLADSKVRVSHFIANRSERPIHLAPWALTVMRPGGCVIMPLPPGAPHGSEHLQSVASLALWSYTDLTAGCWQLGPQYLQFDQRLAAASRFGMQKLGLRNPAGWGAYLNGGHLFIKAIAWRESAYPDLGSNFETFANDKFIELETLGPEATLTPGQSTGHVEYWGLWKDVQASHEGFLPPDIIEREIEPKAEGLLRSFESRDR
ncbi:MAG TPA: hypothetical protein VM009_07880 [Terriglobales bacterium]|nr:hypothetical protein [Terriglobales bacterium]